MTELTEMTELTTASDRHFGAGVLTEERLGLANRFDELINFFFRVIEVQ